MTDTMSNIKDVAVAIVFNQQGQFLLGQRPEGKPYAGYWEFPGGKLEAGESVWEALCRELDEELGIQPQAGTPWVTRVYTYPHATVRLHFWRVTAFAGEPRGREGQAFTWTAMQPTAADAFAGLPQPLLPASLPVLRWLALPRYVVLSHAAAWGVQPFLQACEARFQKTDCPWLLLREPSLAEADLFELYEGLCALCDAYQVPLSISSRHVNLLATKQVNTPLHYTARDVAALGAELTPRTDADAMRIWRGASCHTATELAQLADWDIDYAFLGNVQATASHPGQAGMGWAAWQTLVAGCPVPTYAIGGMTLHDLPQALAAGGQGVALQRGYWESN
jgi:8-oxo-dGTP diphosphatase